MAVHSMDRLARNLDDLRRLVQKLTQRGVRIEFVKECLKFTGEDSPMANLMLSVMKAFAEFERALIRERQREGIALAKQRGAYPRQNGLAVALRELGRIERTMFILDWLQSVELRRRVNAGLNKGEARNALARAVFFNRLGESRDRSFEQQRYRASGLNLVTTAIVLWNTVYLERAAHALRGSGHGVDDALLQYLSPLGW